MCIPRAHPFSSPPPNPPFPLANNQLAKHEDKGPCTKNVFNCWWTKVDKTKKSNDQVGPDGASKASAGVAETSYFIHMISPLLTSHCSCYLCAMSGVLIIPRADIKLLHQYILALAGTSISSHWSVPTPNQPLNMASICLIIAKFIIHSVLLFSNIRLPTLVLICVYNFFHIPPIKKWSLNSSPLDYGLALVTRFYNIKCNGNDTTGLPKLGNLKAVQPPPWCTNTLPSASLSQELALWCFLPNQHAVKKPSSRSHRRRSSQQPSSATRCERSSLPTTPVPATLWLQLHERLEATATQLSPVLARATRRDEREREREGNLVVLSL